MSVDPVKTPRVSVVIPTYRRRASVERVLEALRRQTFSADLFETVVSVDGSEDGTRESVAAFPAPYALKGLWQANRGRAAACNAGVRAARGELIVLLDDDMEPAAEFLEAHVGAHATGATRGVLGAVPVALGDDQSFAITPDACWHVASVLVDGVPVGAVTRLYANPAGRLSVVRAV